MKIKFFYKKNRKIEKVKYKKYIFIKQAMKLSKVLCLIAKFINLIKLRFFFLIT